MAAKADYRDIVAHYEACLAEHGDTHLGVDWPNPEDARKRYKVMLDLVGREAARAGPTLLDFGCGASHLYEYMVAEGWDGVRYVGLDLSSDFVDLSRSKFPDNDYVCGDVLAEPELLPDFDYAVMNGVFTEKRGMSHEDMFAYFERLVALVWERARAGIAFNLMSKQVDWERDDLFHVSYDALAAFLTAQLTRKYVIRNDYGLYEYTVYVLKEGVQWPGS
ncbi:MAG TPA: class I SAM-dependent methyltransferase [Allosphingosinicella sp.]|jgi:SAM-dependent methyltransferase